MSWRRQNRRFVGGRFFFLNFHFRNKNRGGRSGHRYQAGFRAAISVKSFHRVARGHNFRERNKRRAHNIYAAHELIGPTVRENLVNDERLHLKRLRLSAAGKRKSAGDIVNQKSKWFS